MRINIVKYSLLNISLIFIIFIILYRLVWPLFSISDHDWYQVSKSSPWGGLDAGAVAVHNGRIHLLGGWTFNKYIRFGSAVKGRLIYRETIEQDLNDVWSSVDGMNWEHFSPAWSHGMYGMAASFNGSLLYMGGMRDTRRVTESISSSIWSSKDGVNWQRKVEQAQWGPRIGSTLIEHEGQLWIFGGKRSNDDRSESRLNDVWTSSDGIDWKLANSSAAWSPRAFHCSASFAGKMWLIGGGDWDAREARADIWNSSDGVQWTRLPDPPWKGRIWHNCLSFDDKLWVLGGRQIDPIKTVAEAWVTEDGKYWEKVILPKELGPRHAAFVTVFNKSLWWLGGSADNYLQTDSWVKPQIQ
jgi:hypothetical protein